MTAQETHPKPKLWRLAAIAGAIAVLVAAAILLGGSTLRDRWKLVIVALGGGKVTAGGHDVADDQHAAPASSDSIELGEQEQANIGIRIEVLARKSFERTISIPAMIVEVPGRSRLRISAPLTGIVTHIYPTEGQAVGAGEPLFELRLTHEELVQAQSEFLRAVEQLKVADREVERLGELSKDGGLGRQRLREHMYEQAKLAAELRARRQGLQLHGLSGPQVDEIQRSGTLLKGLTVNAPSANHLMMQGRRAGWLQVNQINVELGQHVDIGAPLATLTDYRRLYIQGKAFDQDADKLRLAQENEKKGWRLSAVVNTGGRRQEVLGNLRILRVASGIDQDSRALHFYVPFDNERLDAADDPSSRPRFLNWKHRPGQRVQLHVPVKRQANRLVLPADAVVKDGAAQFVFVAGQYHLERFGDGFRRYDTFLRRSVRVRDRNLDRVMIADDGSLASDARVVVSGAYLIHLAIKKKAGEGGGGHGHVH